MKNHLSRRQFLASGSILTMGIASVPLFKTWGKISPNEKLNIGVIGVSGRGGSNLAGVSKENIVALCDVNELQLKDAAQRYTSAKTYFDFRKMLEQNDMDAVVVSTPDHTHAVAAYMALKTGRHVYCEKPLTRTVSECRIVTDTARQQKLVTQIGTQIHAENNYRRVVELIQSGAIGPVNEVHVYVNVKYGGKTMPTDRPQVPEYLHYDLWLGPVPERFYHPAWVPFWWRDWWAFGGGALSDFGCHYMDLPFWALDLKYPRTIEVVDGPAPDPESCPPWLIVRYEFPARGDKPPVKLTWYHGGKHPELITPDLYQKWKSGVLFIGKKGMLLADYNRNLLLPEKDFQGFVRPQPTIPPSIGHHREWIEAIKNNGKTTCHFDYSGPLTETALLGNVAFRAGKKLEWDPVKLKAVNCPEADQFIQHKYRAGWSIGG